MKPEAKVWLRSCNFPIHLKNPILMHGNRGHEGSARCKSLTDTPQPAGPQTLSR